MDGDGCNSDCNPSATLLFEKRLMDRGEISDVAVDAIGNVIASSPGPWVAQFGPDLSAIWGNTYGAGLSGAALGVATNSDGIYAAGAIDGPGGLDAWVSRIDSNGKVIWEQSGNEPLPDYATEVALAPDGSIFVTGLVKVDSMSSLWLRNYAPDGAVAWTTTFPLGVDVSAVFPLGPGLAVSSSAAVVGYLQRSEDTYPELIVAYSLGGGDPLLSLHLSKASGYIQGVAQALNGDILTVGSSGDSAVFGARRLNPQGDLMWYREDCTGDSGRDVAIDGNGDIVVIGDGPGSDDRNIRLCKFSSSGQLLWGRDIDSGLGQDLGRSVAVDHENRISAGGSLANGMGQEGWLAVFSP